MAMKTKPRKKGKMVASKKAKPRPPASAIMLTPYICVKGAAQAVAFYKKAFGAKESYRLSEPNGRIGHAELTIGTARIMLADEYPDFGARSPLSIGGTPVRLHLSVPDADAMIKRAEKAGAMVLRPVADEFYGARSGMIADPFGHQWFIATQTAKLKPKQMQKQFTALFKG